MEAYFKIRLALFWQSKNLEPLYGFATKDSFPFRFSSGGGREIHFIEEKELDLNDLVSGSLPKVAPDVAIKGEVLFYNFLSTQKE